MAHTFKKFFRGFKRGTGEFGHSISTLVNTILLAIVYLIGIGITSIIARITGKKFLNLKTEDVDSYWTKLDIKRKPLDQYYRQF